MVSWTSGPTERSSVGDVQVPHSHAVQWRWGGCFGSDVNLHLILWCKDLTAATFMLTRPGAVQVGSCWIWFSRQKRQTSLGVTGKEIRWNVWHSEGSGVETQSFVWVWAKGCTGLRAGCLLTVHGECVLLVDWGTELKAFCCFSGRYFFCPKQGFRGSYWRQDLFISNHSPVKKRSAQSAAGEFTKVLCCKEQVLLWSFRVKTVLVKARFPLTGSVSNGFGIFL